MRYHLRIARTRPQGSVDIHSEAFNAPTIEAAIIRAVEVVDGFLGDRPGIAVLTSAYRGSIWSQRYKMPEPPFS
ncbi:hypothetical protein ACLBX9_18740 [Methylobacterium sp. A49B]